MVTDTKVSTNNTNKEREKQRMERGKQKEREKTIHYVQYLLAPPPRPVRRMRGYCRAWFELRRAHARHSANIFRREVAAMFQNWGKDQARIGVQVGGTTSERRPGEETRDTVASLTFGHTLEKSVGHPEIGSTILSMLTSSGDRPPPCLSDWSMETFGCTAQTTLATRRKRSHT